jgi:hypothetical protein
VGKEQVLVGTRVWWKNVDSVKRFYNEYKHLTRLSDWLTYQRHHAKTLSKEKLVAFESIDYYKSAKAHRECDEREWEENFNQLISASSSTGKHRKLQLWLARQRRLLAASLRLTATRKQRFLDYGIDLQPKFCNKCETQRPITTTPAEKEEDGEASTLALPPTTVRPSKSKEFKWMEHMTKLVKYG